MLTRMEHLILEVYTSLVNVRGTCFHLKRGAPMKSLNHINIIQNISLQVAQNRVKVATDGSFCEDTTFVQPLLKIFLFTLRLRSRYLKGTPELTP